MFDADLRAAVRWGLGAAATLAAEHVLTWPLHRHWAGFRRPVPYLLGTATLLGAFWGWACERGQQRAAGALSVITALGGAATVGAYALHARRAAPGLAATRLPTPRRVAVRPAGRKGPSCVDPIFPAPGLH